MLVTALNKQQYARKMSLSFASDLVQLTTFDLNDNEVHERNFSTLENLMKTLSEGPAPTERRQFGHFITLYQSKLSISLRFFEHSSGAGTWHAASLSAYIRAMSAKGELVDWTVGFKPALQQTNWQSVEKYDWKMTSNVRSGSVDGFNRFTINKQALVSDNHEKFDFPDEELSSLSGLTRKQIQGKRPSKRGLLIIYLVTAKKNLETGLEEVLATLPALAISFPDSNQAEK